MNLVARVRRINWSGARVFSRSKFWSPCAKILSRLSSFLFFLLHPLIISIIATTHDHDYCDDPPWKHGTSDQQTAEEKWGRPPDVPRSVARIFSKIPEVSIMLTLMHDVVMMMIMMMARMMKILNKGWWREEIDLWNREEVKPVRFKSRHLKFVIFGRNYKYLNVNVHILWDPLSRGISKHLKGQLGPPCEWRKSA